MNQFDEKWQLCARKARQAPPRDTSVPFGFAGRVLARSKVATAPSVEELLGRLTVRLLAVVVPVLMVCFFLEAPHLRAQSPLDAGVENTVAQLVWRL